MILKDRVAIITGASRGIGAGIAYKYVEEGASLALIARGDEVFDVRDRMKKCGSDVVAFTGDISKKDEIKDILKEVYNYFGRMDVLVNNAGICSKSRFVDNDMEVLQHHIDTNIVGTWNVTQETVKYMIKAGYGKIIIVSSVTGLHVSDPGYVAYATTKSALIGMTKSLAVELADNNITVNSICPGHILTSMSFGDTDKIARQIPLGRYGKPDEVGGLAAFLGSEYSDYITGESIVIDGGAILPETSVW